MTDKEIASKLFESRLWARWAKWTDREHDSIYYAKMSVRTIHHIINSINWED